jgi:protein angel
LPFTLLTCNVLADGYIRREWYPHTPDEWLEPGVRHPALAERLAAQEAGIICLQEVEAPLYATLTTRLQRDGYAGSRLPKGGNKPDGCATFWHPDEFTLLAEQRLAYADGGAGRTASGHVAQLTVLGNGGRRLGVANTHLKWDAPDTAAAQQYGLAQISQLLAACAATAPACAAWIICGDFNVTPDSPLLGVLRDAGFTHAHQAHPGAHTAAPNRAPRVIDYLFHGAALSAAPVLPPVIDEQTPLPGPDHPSDHLALAARFDWI